MRNDNKTERIMEIKKYLFEEIEGEDKNELTNQILVSNIDAQLKHRPLKEKMSKKEIRQNVVGYLSVSFVLFMLVYYVYQTLGWDFIKIAISG